MFRAALVRFAERMSLTRIALIQPYRPFSPLLNESMLRTALAKARKAKSSASALSPQMENAYAHSLSRYSATSRAAPLSRSSCISSITLMRLYYHRRANSQGGLKLF